MDPVATRELDEPVHELGTSGVPEHVEVLGLAMSVLLDRVEQRLDDGEAPLLLRTKVARAVRQVAEVVRIGVVRVVGELRDNHQDVTVPDERDPVVSIRFGITAGARHHDQDTSRGDVMCGRDVPHAYGVLLHGLSAGELETSEPADDVVVRADPCFLDRRR